MEKTLDQKLARIAADPSCRDFSKMTQLEKIQWNLDCWKRIVG